MELLCGSEKRQQREAFAQGRCRKSSETKRKRQRKEGKNKKEKGEEVERTEKKTAKFGMIEVKKHLLLISN